ncbi:MAG: site-2 protease family protein [Candidatus Algichlamydia australiensis]|nr:site-2 protease family protein [Chlamydiales bacterium]
MHKQISPSCLIIGAVLIIGLLVHELGHALTAKYFGSESEITLEAFGGFASFDPSRVSPKQSFLITLNGPLLESMLILVAAALLKFGMFSGYFRYFLSATVWINSIWCILNLLPLDPLDGGKIARFLLTKWFGQRGEKLSIGLGIAAALIAVPILVKFGFYFFSLYLVTCAFRSVKGYEKYDVQSDLSYLNEGLTALRCGEVDKAKLLLTRLKKCHNKQIKNSAMEAVAEIYSIEGKKDKAFHILNKRKPDELKSGLCLLCRLAYERGNHAIVAKHSRRLYELEPTFDTAMLISNSFFCLGNSERGNAWLKTASMFDGVTNEDIEKAQKNRIAL